MRNRKAPTPSFKEHYQILIDEWESTQKQIERLQARAEQLRAAIEAVKPLLFEAAAPENPPLK